MQQFEPLSNSNKDGGTYSRFERGETVSLLSSNSRCTSLALAPWTELARDRRRDAMLNKIVFPDRTAAVHDQLPSFARDALEDGRATRILCVPMEHRVIGDHVYCAYGVVRGYLVLRRPHGSDVRLRPDICCKN